MDFKEVEESLSSENLTFLQLEKKYKQITDNLYNEYIASPSSSSYSSNNLIIWASSKQIPTDLIFNPLTKLKIASQKQEIINNIKNLNDHIIDEKKKTNTNPGDEPIEQLLLKNKSIINELKFKIRYKYNIILTISFFIGLIGLYKFFGYI
jgi:hypothetical protein